MHLKGQFDMFAAFIISCLAGFIIGAFGSWILIVHRNTSAQKDLLAAKDEFSNQKIETEILRTRLEEEKKQSEEKIILLQQARDQMKSDFENLANRIFEEKGKKITEQNRTSLDSILVPLREQIGDFRKKVEDVYDKESRDRSVLVEQITQLRDLNQQISKDAVNLTNALKGESKTQGNWGELILEKVLEQSGLEQGREYDVQVSTRDEEGGRRAPDVIVRLPGEKDIVIDSKVSLSAYERYCSADTDEDRDQALKEHIISLNNHIRNLGNKKYEDLPGIRSLDFVLMFIPIDGALHLAVGNDKELYSRAMNLNIYMVTPSNLLATLRVVSNMWRTESQNRHAMQIAEKAGGLYDKFVGYINDMDNIGKHLDKAREVFQESRSKLSTGKGNLVKRAQELVDMGVKARKALPDTATAESEDE